MTQYISHRVNSINNLKLLNKNYGAEIDVRISNGKLILAHDPFQDGPSFIDWLKFYSHGLLIVNVKEEGLEPYVKDTLNEYNIKNYFLLDQSIPFILKYSTIMDNNVAVRFSEYETVETLLKFKNIAKWVWIDCFNQYPLDKFSINILKKNSFKTCIVSPELQARTDDKLVFEAANLFKKLNFIPDAICTKKIQVWESCL